MTPLHVCISRAVFDLRHGTAVARRTYLGGTLSLRLREKLSWGLMMAGARRLVADELYELSLQEEAT